MTAVADDLGPLLSECVGSECPALSVYPNPNAFPPQPATWRGHDEAFNGVILGNFTLPAGGGAETEGRFAIGGDFLPAGGYSVGISGGGTYVVGPRMGFNNLIVRGSATGTNNPFIGTVLTLGTTVTGLVVIGGSSSGITYDMGVLTTGVGTTPAALGIDFDALFAGLQSKAQCWSQQMSTGTLVDEVSMGNGWVLRGDGTSTLQVFNLGANALNIPGQVLNVDQIPAGATVLVNIAGTTVTINTPLMEITTLTNPTLFNVLFNVFEATTLTVSGDLNTALLAPFADATLNGNLNGRVAIGGDVIYAGAGSEFHSFPFTGELPSCAPPTATATATQTGTATATETGTATATETGTATATETGTATATETGTATATETGTATATETGTATATETGTATATETGTATATETGTATATQTGTATDTATATVTQTATGTPAGTSTATVTGTATASATATVAPSTATQTATRTGTATFTAAPPTPTSTPSSPTATPTITSTRTRTATSTATETPPVPPPVIDPTPEPGDTTVDCNGQPNLDPGAGCILICLAQPGVSPQQGRCMEPGNPIGQGGTDGAGQCIRPGGMPGIPISMPLAPDACVYAYDACNDVVGPPVCLAVEQAPALGSGGLLAGLAILVSIGSLALWRQRSER